MRRKGDKMRALPTIIPFVFRHGSKAWNAPGSIAEELATAGGHLCALEP